MSLSRSPSPRRGGGWSSPGLNADMSHGKVRAASPNITSMNGGAAGSSGGLSWASAKERSARVKDGGWVRRQLSLSLPFSEKEKLGRGRSDGSFRALWTSDWRDIPRRLLLLLSRRRREVAVLLLIVALLTVWNTSEYSWRWGEVS